MISDIVFELVGGAGGFLGILSKMGRIYKMQEENFK